MPESKKAKECFRFYTRLNLSELTGLKASNLQELLANIKEVPESSIYHHTHRFLLQHQYLSPEPPNDFAYWVIMALGEDVLGEKLASIDTVQFAAIRELRAKIITTIENHIKTQPRSITRAAPEDEAFYFMKSISFVMPTNYTACDLTDFVEILKKIAIDSIYFHMFESRLRLEKKTNDFSLWLETSLGEYNLAKKILQLDPYTYTLEDLRKTIVRIIEKR